VVTRGIIGEFQRFGYTCCLHGQYLIHSRQNVKCYKR